MRKSEWLLPRPENHNRNPWSNIHRDSPHKRTTRPSNDVEEINNENKRNV